MASLLKKALVHITVLYEIVQQDKEKYEDIESLSNFVLELEAILLNLPYDPEKHGDAMTVIVAGLDLIHEGLKKLDVNFGKLLFRSQPLIEKMYRIVHKMLLLAQLLAASTQMDGSEVKTDNGEATIINITSIFHHPTAKDFWIKHFGGKVTSVEWDAFKAAFEKELGPQTQENFKRLKKLLGVDATSNDMVSAFEFADFTDTYGVETSYSRLLMRASSNLSPFGTMDGLNELQIQIAEAEQQQIHSPPRIEEIKLEDNEEPKGHAIEANTVWSGVCTERGCETYDMTVFIIEKEDEKIKGKIFWSGDAQTKFRGTVKGPTITFEEYKVIKGINIIPYPNSYTATLDDKMVTITGKWHYMDQQGTITLHYDADATNSLAEVPDETQHREEAITYSGFLNKQSSGLTKKWQHRWFVLENDVLSYAKTKEGYPKKVKGRILMSEVISVHDPNDGAKPTLFEIILQDRTFYLMAENMESKQKWMSILKQDCKKFENPSDDLYNI